MQLSTIIIKNMKFNSSYIFGTSCIYVEVLLKGNISLICIVVKDKSGVDMIDDDEIQDYSALNSVSYFFHYFPPLFVQLCIQINDLSEIMSYRLN